MTRPLPVLLLLATTFPVLAADFYVSPTGDDGNAGTEMAPWRTIQKAADTVAAGSRVFVRGGLYPERITVRVSGSAGAGQTEFLAYPDEQPVIDGTGFVPSETGDDALITIRDRSYVRISGFELRNYRTALRDRVPIGIFVTGNSDFITLDDNVVHHIETRYDGLDGGDAHGIAVYGDDADPIENLVIDGNELHSLLLGSSEALVINGNVSDFAVTNNVVHHCNNIAIDFIGFEGVGPTAPVDRARDGLCAGNRVYQIDSSRNPAYGGSISTGGGDRSAGGIYVDGGARIVVERNVVHDCNIGIELASEHASRDTREITLRNNLVYHNHIGGIFLGGYDRLRGSTDACTVENNTLYRNDTEQDGNGEIYLQFDVRNCVFRNNILSANGQGLLFANPFTENTGNMVDYNLFQVPSGAFPEWQWKNAYYDSLAEWRTATSGGTNSQIADPQFVDPATLDWRLQSGSPARDTGNPAHPTGTGETDFDGETRIENARIDIGCYEFRTGDSGAAIEFLGKGMLIVSGDDTPEETDGTEFPDTDWTRGTTGQGFSIRNTATTPYRILSQGIDSTAFRMQRQIASVLPGEERDFDILFAPRRLGKFEARVTLLGTFPAGFAIAGTGVRPAFQPDFSLGRNPRSLRGNDLYRSNGAGQRFTQVARRRPVTFHFRLENDGANSDVFFVRGTRENRLFRSTYLRLGPGRRMVTGAMTRGRERASLPSTRSTRYQLRIQASATARKRRRSRNFTIFARSRNEPARLDRTWALVRAR